MLVKQAKQIRKRIYEHKASAQKDGIITPVSRHFKSEGHNHTHTHDILSVRMVHTKI